MDKLEYIPGDLVMVKKSALQFAKDKIFKVISSLSGGFVKVVMLNDSSTTYSISNNAIRPIPLTPEILEKNGWEPTKESLGHSFKNKKYPRFALWSINDKWSFTIDGVMVCNTLSCLCYVHELQHLLFGLGFKHEIEV